MVQINGLNKVADVVTNKGESMEDKELMKRIHELQQQLEEAKKGINMEKKNHKPGKASPTRKYVLLSKKLSDWGKVPQQQQDIADLLAKHMEVGKEYTEAEVFNLLIDQCGEYKSLCNSVQDPTYLFKYYRGLNKSDGKHKGYIARNFVRMVD